MPHGLFLCCGFGHNFEEYAEKQFPKELRETAFELLSFGGYLKLERAGLWERLLLYRIRVDIRESEIDDYEFTPTLPGILPENVSRMATAVKEAMRRLKDQQGK